MAYSVYGSCGIKILSTRHGCHLRECTPSRRNVVQNQPMFYHKLKFPSTCEPGKRNTRVLSALTPALEPENQDSSRISEAVRRLLGSSSPPLSDIVWSSVGAFLAMAGFALADHALASKGLSMTMGSFAALCVLLFAVPQSPTSQKWNVIVAQIGCAFVSVCVLAVWGAGWFSRSLAVALCIAFMLFSGSVNPPAAGLPLIFLDASKFQHLGWWYIVFPGLLGCFYLFFLQAAISFLKRKIKF